MSAESQLPSRVTNRRRAQKGGGFGTIKYDDKTLLLGEMPRDNRIGFRNSDL
jgi:hypothetical protein